MLTDGRTDGKPVGWFFFLFFNGPLRQFFNLYRAVSQWGWSGGAMVLGKLPVPGRPTIWMIVGQGPSVLAVGAGGGCLDIFILIYLYSPLSPFLWETARYRLKYCLKGPLNPKQPTNRLPKRGRQRRQRVDESINVQTTPTRAPNASAVGTCPTVIQIVGRPGTGSLPSTIAPPDHPHRKTGSLYLTMPEAGATKSRILILGSL